ncbi:MAG: biotin carboxylase, partial [Ginsengibacter sp.]
EGSEVSVYYDPMLAKLISYGKNREEAINTMLQAIDEYIIEGVSTTLPFGHFVLTHPSFLSGNFSTGFVETYYSKDIVENLREKESKLAARLALYQHIEEAKKLRVPNHLLKP